MHAGGQKRDGDGQPARSVLAMQADARGSSARADASRPGQQPASAAAAAGGEALRPCLPACRSGVLRTVAPSAARGSLRCMLAACTV